MNPEDFRSSSSGRAIRTPRGFAAFVPNPLPPSLTWTPALAQALSEADRALGALAGLGNALPNPHLLVSPFVRREAVLSSRIEGTRASLTDLYVLEAKQLELFETPADVHEVHNYVTALEFGFKRSDKLPISLRLIREIHARLMEGVRGEHLTPGEFRQTPNWIGPAGSTLETAPYVPPPPEEMQQTLADFETFLHAESDLPPLVRLGLVHYQFEAIHPFLDGNGRVGRLLISILLGAWNLMPQPLLYLSAYFEAHQQGYYDQLLAVSQRGAWNEWLIFFLDGVAVQSRDAVQRIQRLQDLRERYRQRVQATRAAARLLQVVDLLFANPLITVSTVQSALKVQFPVAQRYVNQLVTARVLREITGRARNRVYRAEEILRVIDAPLE
jgi:Fic family protein